MAGLLLFHVSLFTYCQGNRYTPLVNRREYRLSETREAQGLNVQGPTVWNALSNDLRDPELRIVSFGRLLKTHLFQRYLGALSALYRYIQALCDNAIYKLALTLTRTRT